MDPAIHRIEEKVQHILKDKPEHFLVEVKIKPTNNVKVFIDGDGGIGLDDLVKYNRTLYKLLEEEAFFPEGDFSLEVSSAGLGEPLKLHRQYVKNIGRFVEVIKQEGQKIEGRLEAVGDDEILVEEIKGKATGNPSAKSKKTEIIKHNILFEDIKSTQIQIKF